MREVKIKYFKNGEKYEGEFLDNKEHGYGRFTFRNGVTIDGIWINGEFSIKQTEKNQKLKQTNINYKNI